jgi:hypothetical protein
MRRLVLGSSSALRSASATSRHLLRIGLLRWLVFIGGGLLAAAAAEHYARFGDKSLGVGAFNISKSGTGAGRRST